MTVVVIILILLALLATGTPILGCVFNDDGKQVAFLQRDVGQLQLLRHLLASFDGNARQIQAGELAAGQGHRHGNQVESIAAAQFEDAA